MYICKSPLNQYIPVPQELSALPSHPHFKEKMILVLVSCYLHVGRPSMLMQMSCQNCYIQGVGNLESFYFHELFLFHSLKSMISLLDFVIVRFSSIAMVCNEVLEIKNQ